MYQSDSKHPISLPSPFVKKQSNCMLLLPLLTVVRSWVIAVCLNSLDISLTMRESGRCSKDWVQTWWAWHHRGKLLSSRLYFSVSQCNKFLIDAEHLLALLFLWMRNFEVFVSNCKGGGGLCNTVCFSKIKNLNRNIYIVQFQGKHLFVLLNLWQQLIIKIVLVLLLAA